MLTSAMVDKTARAFLIKCLGKNAVVAADPQVFRVAQRIAIVAMAGDLGKSYGILPAACAPLESSMYVCQRWLEERGGIGSGEEKKILDETAAWLLGHSVSGFLDPKDNSLKLKPIDLLGYRTEAEDGTVTFQVFRVKAEEFFKSHFTLATALAVLEKNGMLLCSTDTGLRHYMKKSPDFLGLASGKKGARVRMYCLRMNLEADIPSEESEETEKEF